MHATADNRSSPPSARDRIVSASHDLFYQHGIRATGIDRVIEEAGVTKVTFYRHFPSKHDLIRAYLAYRHALWLNWFEHALQSHGGQADALAPTLAEWFQSPQFRGCAFINAVDELHEELPDVIDISRQHKDDMTKAIAGLLAPSRHRAAQAQALSLAVDGAIVQAQRATAPAAALKAFELIRKAVTGTPGSAR